MNVSRQNSLLVVSCVAACLLVSCAFSRSSTTFRAANPNQRDHFGETPLIIAATQGGTNAVKVLTTGGANVNMQSNDGSTALMRAAENGHDDVVTMLLDHRAGPDLLNEQGYTALMLAARAGHDACVQALLQHGARRNIEDGAVHMTALMHAVMGGHYHVVENMLVRGVDPNVKNSHGWTALFVAVYTRGDFADGSDLVRLLLELGADRKGVYRLRDGSGKTVLQIADDNGYASIVDLLREPELAR